MPSVLHKIKPKVKFFGSLSSVSLLKIKPRVKFLKVGGSAGDTTAPIVTVISPPEGQIPGALSEASKVPTVFTVQDVVPGFGFLRVRIRYTEVDEQCTVHNGTDFETGFKRNSTKTAMQFNKFQFSIVPDDGWISAFDLEVDAIDAAGNIAT